MSAEKKTILDDCDSWAPVPTWALFHPKMTHHGLRAFALLITKSDKESGETYPYKRADLARWCNFSPESWDRAVDVLEEITCLEVMHQKRAILDDQGKHRKTKTGRPIYWWGPSRYRVILKDPGVSSDLTTGVSSPMTRGVVTHDDRGVVTGDEKVSIAFEPQEPSSIDLSATSQAKVSGEGHEINKILGDRRLPREIPCEPLDFAKFMQQMSRDCFGGQLPSQVTQSNYNELKRYCKEIAQSLVGHHKPVDPAYLYAFAYYYEDMGHDRHSTPKPISYSKGWDDEDFWNSEWCMKRVREYRDALALDPDHPLLFNHVWKTG